MKQQMMFVSEDGEFYSQHERLVIQYEATEALIDKIKTSDHELFGQVIFGNAVALIDFIFKEKALILKVLTNDQ